MRNFTATMLAARVPAPFTVRYNDFSCAIYHNFSSANAMKLNLSTDAVKAKTSIKWSKNWSLYHESNCHATFSRYEKYLLLSLRQQLVNFRVTVLAAGVPANFFVKCRFFISQCLQKFIMYKKSGIARYKCIYRTPRETWTVCRMFVLLVNLFIQYLAVQKRSIKPQICSNM